MEPFELTSDEATKFQSYSESAQSCLNVWSYDSADGIKFYHLNVDILLMWSLRNDPEGAVDEENMTTVPLCSKCRAVKRMTREKAQETYSFASAQLDHEEA